VLVTAMLFAPRGILALRPQAALARLRRRPAPEPEPVPAHEEALGGEPAAGLVGARPSEEAP
jgi:hypothetical protein